MAMAFSNAKNFLEKNVSKDSVDWKWGDIHMVDFSNLPWSKTPLMILYHRQINAPGNGNTPNVSKYKLRLNQNNQESAKIYSDHTANYRQLV